MRDPNVMTPHAFAEEVRDVLDKRGGDPEEPYGEFDSLMERVLEELGYGEGIRLIRQSTRWCGRYE